MFSKGWSFDERIAAVKVRGCGKIRIVLQKSIGDELLYRWAETKAPIAGTPSTNRQQVIAEGLAYADGLEDA